MVTSFLKVIISWIFPIIKYPSTASFQMSVWKATYGYILAYHWTLRLFLLLSTSINKAEDYKKSSKWHPHTHNFSHILEMELPDQKAWTFFKFLVPYCQTTLLKGWICLSPPVSHGPWGFDHLVPNQTSSPTWGEKWEEKKEGEKNGTFSRLIGSGSNFPVFSNSPWNGVSPWLMWDFSYLLVMLASSALSKLPSLNQCTVSLKCWPSGKGLFAPPPHQTGESHLWLFL